jgi:hypothetical protein
LAYIKNNKRNEHKKEGEPNKALVFYDSLGKQLFDVF